MQDTRLSNLVYHIILKAGPWSILRVVRIVIGALLLSSAYADSDWLIGLFGLVILVQGIWNTGCGIGAFEPGMSCEAELKPIKKDED